MLRLAIVLPLLTLVLASCANVPEPESTSVPAVVQAAPATMPDLRAQPVHCEVPSVCTTKNGDCRSLGIVPNAEGRQDVASACRWLAERMQLGDGSGFALMSAESVLYESEQGDKEGLRWAATVCASFRGTLVPQRNGTLTSHTTGLEWNVPAVSFTPMTSGLGVVYDAAYAKAKFRANTLGPEDPEALAVPILVYARPNDLGRRQHLQWPDESAGPVYRPSWAMYWHGHVFVDAGLGLMWVAEVH